MKVTIAFPGQGTQYVGMGEKHLDHQYFEKINSTLGYDLKTMMLKGPAEELKLTQNTQPAIVAHSLILFSILEKKLAEKNIQIERVLGHSVGEYSALAAAKVLSFEDAIKAVHFRGKFMQEAAPQGKGTMYAILKQEESLIREACKEASDHEFKVSPANFNEPAQIVISGDKPACEKAIQYMEQKTGSRVKAIELQVSAPFHCELMKPAEKNLSQVLDTMNFTSPTISYVANIDATEYGISTSPLKIKENLLKQVCGSVLWTHSIQKLSNESLVIECGPGKVLAGLIKKINPTIKVISLDSENGFQEVEAL
jgi:[acyl-carrier-protein] S-malonyltransferase